MEANAAWKVGRTMGNALSAEARLDIYERHGAGEKLTDIARSMGIHYETARKWWRVGRGQGREGLVHRRRRPPRQVLHGVPDRVRERLAALRGKNPAWGVPYLRQQLLESKELTADERKHVPSVAAIYRYLHQVEQNPLGRTKLAQDTPSPPLVDQAEHPHHLWQMDLKEKCAVSGLPHRVTVVTARDVYSSVTVASEVVALRRYASTLSGATVQAMCRKCFARWGLPDILRTDNGSCFVGTMPQTGFPSYLTLWLTGLGVRHETIDKGQVTQNGCVERYSRTYSNLALRNGPYADVEELQRVSDLTVEFLNTKYPSRAGRCGCRPPLEAYPEALTPRRAYREEAAELGQFSLGLVDTYLAQFRWRRTADPRGQIALGGARYWMGKEHAHEVFEIVFDPQDRSFVFTRVDNTAQVRLPAKGLEAADIIGHRTRRRRQTRSAENNRPL